MNDDSATKRQRPETAKLFVGYRTRTAEGYEALMPEFRAPSHWKDTAKIAAEVEVRKQAFLAGAKDCPYVGTFDQVFLVDPSNNQAVLWDYRPPGSGKQPISLAVRAYLIKFWKDAWKDDMTTVRNRVPPAAIFVGFDMRTFLKILGLECSMPAVGKPLPLRLWYDNTDHRDIGEAVLPKEFKQIGLAEVVKARRPMPTSDPASLANLAKWDRATDGWTGPGIDPRKDVDIAVILAAQLGMIKE